MTKEELQSAWTKVCNEYLRQFCEKHDYEFETDAWVGIGKENIGTVADIADVFIDMENIRYDIDNDIDKDLFEKWYWKRLDLYECGVEHWLNYPSYCSGAPDDWTPERMKELRELHNKVIESKMQLEKYLDEYKEKQSSL